MSADLREELDSLARTQTFSPDPTAWERGRRARRRGHVLAVAAVLAILASVGGVATLVSVDDDREARTASTEVVEGGAIPSRIIDPGGLEAETDLAVGRASVAFVGSDGRPVVVTATDGRYHGLALTGWDGRLLSLSPDGTHLAWTIESDTEGRLREGFALLDLVSGDIRLISSGSPASITPEAISWSPSSTWLTWFAGDTVTRTRVESTAVETSATGKQVEWSAVDDDGVVTFYAQGPRRWGLDGAYGRMTMSEDASFDAPRRGRNDAAIASPSGRTVALASSADAAAVDFLDSGRFAERALAPDLYPAGAAVRPLGWADDSLLLAHVDAPSGSYVEGPHLALLTSPDRPRSEWTYRIVMRDVPDVTELGVAVDLVPDLDGTSSQRFTHDFGASPASPRPLGIELSLFIGLAVAAAIAVLLALRWLWRRLLGP